ncbi:DsbA family protein [Nitrosomonas sp. Is24]|uniref:DsbA family protein n=1 Tax=Nitrosomonas sp. Is24 TaxID=3080533 RepID=UPI00294B6366|nr:DsbA family protein [Nitrosomonas sp. Is24]MDV6342310.1 DsbA family protein [Nitrosomonas sp. Is24]
MTPCAAGATPSAKAGLRCSRHCRAIWKLVISSAAWRRIPPNTTEPMPLATQKMVQQAWQRIEQTVPGVHFNWDFWSRNTPIRSTYPACRAVLAAKKQRAEAEPEMIRAIQTTYYQQAKNPSLPETLQACAQKIGLNAETFSDDLKSATIEAELQRQMQRARGMDVYSYPSLRLVINNAVFPIAIDYLDYRTMLDEIKTIESKVTRT